MKLVLTRSQRSAGLISSKVLFSLHARAELTDEEAALIKKYKLGAQVVYDSEARKQRNDATLEGLGSGGFGGIARGLASAAMASLTLRITIDSLTIGQQIECKELNDLLAAEVAMRTACESIITYLQIASTFDGSEQVVDFPLQAA